METKTIAAWVIIALMGLSILGYGFLSSTSFVPTPPAPQLQEAPAIVERPLTPTELATALRQGKVVFRSAHASACAACNSTDAAIEQFTLQFSLFATFEKLVDPLDNSSRLQLIGSAGRVIDLDPTNVTQAGLLDTFCANAPLQPKECIVRTISQNQRANAEAQNTTQSSAANETQNETAPANETAAPA